MGILDKIKSTPNKIIRDGGNILEDIQAWTSGKSAPQVAGIPAQQMNPAGADLSRQQYMNVLTGQAPTYSQLAFQNYKNQLASQAQSLARSSRGSSPALAMRGAQEAQANMGANIAGQSAAMEAQEKQQLAQALMDEYLKKLAIQSQIDMGNAQLRASQAITPASILSAAGTVGTAAAGGKG